MGQRTRNLTLSALFIALSVISLYIASVWPTGLLGLVAVASLFVAATVIEVSTAFGFYVYIISSVLGVLILPNIAAPLLYIFFFGYYPVVKSLIEHLKSVVMQWALKLFVFIASLTIIWFLFKDLIFNFGENPPHIILIYLGGSVVFSIFDYGYTKLIWFYINRISKNMKGNRDKR